MDKILVVSNMYPDNRFPYYGIFVKNFCRQLEEINISYKLSVLTKKISKPGKLIGYIVFYILTFIQCVFGRYQLVYVHYASFSSLPVLLARKIRKFKIYVNVHGSDVFPLKKSHHKMQKYTKKIVKAADRIVTPSGYFKDVVVKKYCVDEKKVYIYPSGGIDLKKFRPFKKSRIDCLKKKYGINNVQFCIGYVSRINKTKGWDIFLKAAKKVLDGYFDCIFLMVGNGEDDEKLTDMIKELELEQYIYRLPQQPQDKLPEIYNIIDLFVFPTISSESLGLVAIEAMACGCPVVASDCAAPGEYIIENVNGKKFPKGDYKSLADCIKTYLESDICYRQMLKDGALSTAEDYGTEKAKELLYKTMC